MHGFHTPHGSARFRLPWSWSSFDYRTLCEELWAQSDASSRSLRRRRSGDEKGSSSERLRPPAAPPLRRQRAPDGVTHDRGPITAPLVVDALGWRRVLGPGPNVQPPEALTLARARGPPRRAGRRDLDVWIDRALVRRGYAWSVPAAGEQRVGVGSYEPRHHVKAPTQEIAERLGVPAVRYQGNWFPHALRPAAEGGVFFVGDSAGHCFPLSGEGIRTAFYFGIACGRELRRVLAGEATREEALAAYGAFSAAHAPAFRTALRLQRAIPALPPRALTALLAVMGRARPCRRAFTWYLEQAHPRFAAAQR